MKKNEIEVTVNIEGLNYDSGYGDIDADFEIDCVVTFQDVVAYDTPLGPDTRTEVQSVTFGDSTLWLIGPDGESSCEIPDYDFTYLEDTIKAKAIEIAKRKI